METKRLINSYSRSAFIGEIKLQKDIKRHCTIYHLTFFFICYTQVEKGMVLMANYNCDEPSERGFWYDVKVTRKVEFFSQIYLLGETRQYQRGKALII